MMRCLRKNDQERGKYYEELKFLWIKPSFSDKFM